MTIRPPTIVDWLEAVPWLEAAPGVQPLALSEPTKTWVDRCWHAFISMDVGETELDRLVDVFFAYLDTVDERERIGGRCAYTMLVNLVAYGLWPTCPGCGAVVCPHCGHEEP